ncbi:MAG: hypothetical protein ACM3O3_07570 [Syntrophothermus sp.]
MGAAVIMDVIGSAVIGGLLLLILFRTNDNITMNTYNFSGEVTLQENLVATIEVLEFDFRKIGYCENPLALPDPETDAILYADTSEIIFLTDITGPDLAPGDGTLDTLRYRLGPTSELTGTPNPNDRLLYREVNGEGQGVNLGVTYFKIRYFRDSLTSSGSTTLAEILDLPKTHTFGTPTGITAMQIDIKVENTATYGNPDDNPYRHAFWRQIRLSSRNLRR